MKLEMNGEALDFIREDLIAQSFKGGEITDDTYQIFYDVIWEEFGDGDWADKYEKYLEKVSKMDFESVELKKQFKEGLLDNALGKNESMYDHLTIIAYCVLDE